MTDILKGYRTYLLAQATVTGQISTRVYFNHLPQDPTYPAVVLNLLSSESERSLSAQQPFARSSIQVDCHDDTYNGANAIAETIRTLSENYSNTTWGTETISSSHVRASVDLTEPPITGSQLYTKIRSLDVVTWHVQAT